MTAFPSPAPRGVFFSFEGIDGSGKSTQARLLHDALRAEGHDVLLVREPGGTPLGEQVRALLLDPDTDVTPRAEALLFAAARAMLVERVIEPALAAGQHVIADRFVDSTTAYQGAGRSLGDALVAVSSFATAGRMPDRTYLVHVSLDTGLRRRSAREADRMERSDLAFRQRVAAAYDVLASEHPNRIQIVTGEGSPEDVHNVILADAHTLIPASAPAPRDFER